MSDPDDPISALAASAVGAHELFVSLVGAGFTDNQALYLVGQIVAAGARGPAA